ncbi:hypothetical protein [Butyrivibrio proteoclasticus]|uniref:hypothetical protein n=1 Tax=Butyrivibrio proteoclasticus TaxID=43305 RepID=UPI00054D8B78|nr:hypothetical protein [Butyrivibrio proteoclasticus]
MTASKFLKKLIIWILVLVVAVGAVVYAFDPFYHYHKPWFGLKAVLNDKEYQCIGTLRHFDYDALLVGSSVMENNDNTWYDEAYGVKSIKAIRSYGATADLCYLLDEAFDNQEIRYVFYNIDPSSLSSSAETTYESTGCPMYLYDKNPFNDVQYLFNKDVLFEKIPYQVANSYMGDYQEGKSYNWAQWKNFSENDALGLYFRPIKVHEMYEETYYQDELNANIALLTKRVEDHPETQFIFFYPAYSMLWWDGIYRTGERDAYIYNEIQMTKALLTYDNVRIFCFQDLEEVTTNLNYYMDSIHFSPEINKLMLDKIVAGENEMTLDNYEQMLYGVKDFSDRVVNELIVPYEEADRLSYEIVYDE